MADMEKKPVEIKTLKEGGFVIIDDVPCVVTAIAVSKAGKHGAAKARVTAMGIFDKQRRVIVKPGGSKVDVPLIDKRNAQVIAKTGDGRVQIMDLTDFSYTEVEVPEGMGLSEGDEVLVWRFGDYIMVKGKKN
jgi:translation initiation factor 5A